MLSEWSGDDEEEDDAETEERGTGTFEIVTPVMDSRRMRKRRQRRGWGSPINIGFPKKVRAIAQSPLFACSAQCFAQRAYFDEQDDMSFAQRIEQAAFDEEDEQAALSLCELGLPPGMSEDPDSAAPTEALALQLAEAEAVAQADPDCAMGESAQQKAKAHPVGKLAVSESEAPNEIGADAVPPVMSVSIALNEVVTSMMIGTSPTAVDASQVCVRSCAQETLSGSSRLSFMRDLAASSAWNAFESTLAPSNVAVNHRVCTVLREVLYNNARAYADSTDSALLRWNCDARCNDSPLLLEFCELGDREHPKCVPAQTMDLMLSALASLHSDEKVLLLDCDVWLLCVDEKTMEQHAEKVKRSSGFAARLASAQHVMLPILSNQQWQLCLATLSSATAPGALYMLDATPQRGGAVWYRRVVRRVRRYLSLLLGETASEKVPGESCAHHALPCATQRDGMSGYHALCHAEIAFKMLSNGPVVHKRRAAWKYPRARVDRMLRQAHALYELLLFAEEVDREMWVKRGMENGQAAQRETECAEDDEIEADEVQCK